MKENKWLLFAIMAITLVYAMSKRTERNRKQCIRIVTMILVCFSGLRSWRMGDLFHYCYVYLECNMPGWTPQFNSIGDTLGLQLFFRLCGQLGLGFEACIFIIAAFVAITLGVLVYRYSPSPYWSYVTYLAMGFYISSFNILKQVMAMGFIVLAMIAIFEHKPGWFVAWVALASVFHTPALVFAIAYPFANKKINMSYFMLIAGMVAAIFMFRDEIVKQATEVYYVDSVEYETSEVIGTKFVFMLLILAAAMVFRPLRNYDTRYKQLFSVMILAAIVQSFSVYDNVFSRLADYFYQFVVLFIPLMLQPGYEQARLYPEHTREIRYWQPKVMLVVQLGVTVFSIYYFYNYVAVGSGFLSQFRFVWESEEPGSLELLAEALKAYTGP